MNELLNLLSNQKAMVCQRLIDTPKGDRDYKKAYNDLLAFDRVISILKAGNKK